MLTAIGFNFNISDFISYHSSYSEKTFDYYYLSCYLYLINITPIKIVFTII